MSVVVDLPKVVIEINDTLLLGETASEEYTPPTGKTVTVMSYVAELPFSEEVASCISWDAVAEWNIRESGAMPFEKFFTTDGVKKFKLLLENINASSPQGVSARVILDVR